MIRVLMLCEGTYPFYRGGVSTWTHNLISNLEDYRFLILSVTSTPFLSLKYELPTNVDEVLNVPLWGTEIVKEHIGEFKLRDFLGLSLSTSERDVQEEFAPSFKTFLNEVKYGCRNPKRLGEAIYEMHLFLTRHDHRKTVRSESFWKTVWEELAEDKLYGNIKISRLIEFSRIIGFLLRLLSYEYPETDLCHSSAAALCGLPGVILKIREGIPYIITEHGVYFRERILDLPLDATLIERILWINFYRAISRVNHYYADKILPVCSFNVNWEKELGTPLEKIEVIYNGVDVERFRPMDVGGVEGDFKRIVVMARIDKLKDITNMVEAMTYVSREYPNVRCEVYGPIVDERYHEMCRRKVKEFKLERKVFFMGPTDKPELVYNKGYVVAQPSLSEGFPYTVVEAMACGKPVVATDVGGVREALGECGILVPARSPVDLAEGLLKVLKDDKLAEKLGEKARNRVLKFFTYEKFLENYRRVYLEVLSEKTLKEASTWRKF